LKNLSTLLLDRETTFFTNLYLGLRTSGKNTDDKEVKSRYSAFCLDFFKQQLAYINPRIVLCLGTPVMQAMAKVSSDFSQYEGASVTKLYDPASPISFEAVSDGRRYIFIPHPSYAHINWQKYDIKDRIVAAMGE
jgi:uracil-DNA glycosylase